MSYIPASASWISGSPTGASNWSSLPTASTSGKRGTRNLVELAELQHRVAHGLQVPVGRLLMGVKSAHIYDPEIEAMRAMCTAAAANHSEG